MEILIIGMVGFIGYHLAKKFLYLNCEVLCYDNINDCYNVNLKYARIDNFGLEQDEAKDDILAQPTNNLKYKFIKTNLEDVNILSNLFETAKFNEIRNLAVQAGIRCSIDKPRAYIGYNVLGFMNIFEDSRNVDVKILSYASSSFIFRLNKLQLFKITNKIDTSISLYTATKKSNELRVGKVSMFFAYASTNDRPIQVFNYGDMCRGFTYGEKF